MQEEFVELWVVEYSTLGTTLTNNKFLYTDYQEDGIRNEHRFYNEHADQTLILHKRNLCHLLIRPLNLNQN
jgi:hypothetical protein